METTGQIQRKEETRSLWELCFHDSREFTDLYFGLRYADGINHTLRKEGKTVAALQTIPYPMTFGGSTVPTAYVSGACTHPDYRGRGYMGQLLNETFIDMYRKGVCLTTLIPAGESLFGYYARFGYAASFDRSVRTTEAGSLQAQAVSVTDASGFDRTDIHAYMQRRLSERPCCLLHTAEDLRVVLADLKLSDGRLLVAHGPKGITGLAFCIPDGQGTYLPELLHDTPEVRDALLKAALHLYGSDRATYVVPAPGRQTKALGMARIVHAERMLQLYANRHKDIRMEIEVTDEQLPMNEGCYRLADGTCLRTDTPSASCVRLTIGCLTQALLGYHTERLPEALRTLPSQYPYMSLMLD